jgi:hypothetical protein
MTAGFDWDAELSAADRDALINRCARLVAERGLTTPAILFLEMHRPLGFLAGQSLILASGFLAPLFGPQRVQQLSRLLQSRDSVDRLIARIESLAHNANASQPQVESQDQPSQERKG